MKFTLDGARTIVSLNLEEARETAKYDHRTSEYWPTLIGERLWFLNMLNNIEAEPKHGRWNGDTCSVCGFSWCDVTYEAPQTEMSFCPNCGTRMLDEVEE